MRRADLAALLVGAAAIGYTAFALMQPTAPQDTAGGAAHRGPLTSQAPSAGIRTVLAPGPTSSASPTSIAMVTSTGRGAATGSTASTAAGSHARRQPDGRPRPGGGGPHPADDTRRDRPAPSDTTHTGTTHTGSTHTGTQQAGTGSSRGTPAATGPGQPKPQPGVPVPCSQPSLLLVQVTFVNSTSVPLRLEHSLASCLRLSIDTVAPGGHRTVLTWASNAWIFTDPATGRPVAAHVVRPGERVVNMP